MLISDGERRLSKRSGATEQRKFLEEKLKVRQEKDRQKALAKAQKVKLSEAADATNLFLVPNILNS